MRDFLREVGKDAANTTTSMYSHALSSFYEWLRYEDILDDNPVSTLRDRQKRIGKKSTPKKRLPSVLTEDEVQSLFYGISQGKGDKTEISAIVGLILDTGLRISEALSMTVRDGITILNEGTLRVVGKGNKERLVRTLREYEDLLRAYVYKDQRDPNERLFSVRRAGAYRAIKRALSRAGIQKPQMGPHLLRHTAASLMLKHNWTLAQVRDNLGHSSIAITEIYLHVV